MRKITGHHIAYATCQVRCILSFIGLLTLLYLFQARYALCAKDSWTEHDGAFDMEAFYLAIVDLFEDYPDNEMGCEDTCMVE